MCVLPSKARLPFYGLLPKFSSLSGPDSPEKTAKQKRISWRIPQWRQGLLASFFFLKTHVFFRKSKKCLTKTNLIWQQPQHLNPVECFRLHLQVYQCPTTKINTNIYWVRTVENKLPRLQRATLPMDMVSENICAGNLLFLDFSKMCLQCLMFRGRKPWGGPGMWYCTD